MTDFNEMIAGQPAMTPTTRKEPGVDSETQGLGMKISAPANASFLNKAVAHLNHQVQRGEHDPMKGC